MTTSQPNWADSVASSAPWVRRVTRGGCGTSLLFSSLPRYLRDCSEPDDGEVNSHESFRETLRRAGYKEGCHECRLAVARGVEACVHHYVPTSRRAS